MLQSVTKEEFDQFLAQYPHKLERDVALICEPPLISYNDFSLGNWPESIVASHSFSDWSSKNPSGWMVRRA